MKTQISFYQSFDRDAVYADTADRHAWLRIEQQSRVDEALTEVVFHFKDRAAVVALADRLNSIASEMVDQAERAQLTSDALLDMTRKAADFVERKALEGEATVCAGCNRVIWPDGRGSWLDNTDGDGCGDGVHRPAAEPPRMRLAPDLADIAHNPDPRD